MKKEYDELLAKFLLSGDATCESESEFKEAQAIIFEKVPKIKKQREL